MDNQAQDNVIPFTHSSTRQSHLLELCGTRNLFRKQYQIAKAIATVRKLVMQLQMFGLDQTQEIGMQLQHIGV